MSRIADLMTKSQSGPDLYMNMEDQVITLGQLHFLLCEVENAVQVAQSAIEQLDNGYEENTLPALTGRLSLEYAYDCLMGIRPDKDVEARDFWVEDDKITFVDPIEAIKARIKAEKAKKGGAA